MMQNWQSQIRDLASSRDNAPAFYDEFLRIVAQASDGVTALAWDCSAEPFNIISRNPSHYDGSQLEAQADHHALLDKVATLGKPILVKPQLEDATTGDDRPVIALTPIQRNGRREIVEVFFRPNEPDAKYSDSLRSINELCDEATRSETEPLAPEVPTAREIEPELEEPSDWSPNLDARRCDEFIHDVHASLDFLETCYTLANQAQILLNCDRVSVIRFKRKASQTVAISGQASVNRRANAVRLLESVANRVLSTGQSLCYPSDDEDDTILPQIEKPLHDYLLESNARTLVIVPIWNEDAPQEATADESLRDRPRRVVGGLVVEHFARQLPKEQLEPAVELAVRHGGAGFRNALRHRELFLFPVWDWLGKSKALATARNLPKVASISAALLIVLAILVFFPASFSVSSKGVLVPETRRKVFTQVDGVIDQVHVGHGAMVKANEPLVTMHSDDLSLELERIAGQIDTLEQQIQSIDALSLSYSRRAGEDATKLENSKIERQSLVKRVESLNRQQAIVEEQIKKLSVTSPIAGQIITWNVDERLLNRPVIRGRALMEVAEVEGRWVIELDLPDRRIGYVRDAQQRLKDPLLVTFILAADPRNSFKGRVLDVAQATEVDPEKGQTVRVTVELDSPIDIQQVRTDVSAKIHCGRRSLGFVWFHDVFEFVQTKILFPLG